MCSNYKYRNINGISNEQNMHANENKLNIASPPASYIQFSTKKTPEQNAIKVDLYCTTTASL